MLSLGVIDEIIAEPLGGAHRHAQAAMTAVGTVIAQHLQSVKGLSVEELMEQRYAKFRRMGEVGIIEDGEEYNQEARSVDGAGGVNGAN